MYFVVYFTIRTVVDSSDDDEEFIPVVEEVVAVEEEPLISAYKFYHNEQMGKLKKTKCKGGGCP